MSEDAPPGQLNRSVTYVVACVAMQLAKSISLIVSVSALLVGCESSASNLAEAAIRGEKSYKQYKTSDYATAKAALLDYITFLDRLAIADPSLDNTCTADAIFSYVRLARLERKNHGSDENRYMTEAVSRCNKSKTKFVDCSEETLNRSVDILDKVPVR